MEWEEVNTRAPAEGMETQHVGTIAIILLRPEVATKAVFLKL